LLYFLPQLSPQWLLSFNSEEVAQQLTLIEQSYYMLIEPRSVIFFLPRHHLKNFTLQRVSY